MTGKASGRKSSLARERGAALKRSAAAHANGGGEPTVVFFDDMRLVRDLLGDYDANLAVLEDRLGIEAVVNGNAVSLQGTRSLLRHGEIRARAALWPARARRDDRRRRGGRRHPPCEDRRAGGGRGAQRGAARGAADPDAQTPHHRAHAGAERLSRLAQAERPRLRHRPCRHRQDLSRRRLRRRLSRERAVRPADPVAAGGRGRRAARLPSRRHAREGRSVSSARSTTRSTTCSRRSASSADSPPA